MRASKSLWSVWTDNLMLSIGRHVDFWRARQKFWRRPTARHQCGNPCCHQRAMARSSVVLCVMNESIFITVHIRHTYFFWRKLAWQKLRFWNRETWSIFFWWKEIKCCRGHHISVCLFHNLFCLVFSAQGKAPTVHATKFEFLMLNWTFLMA